MHASRVKAPRNAKAQAKICYLHEVLLKHHVEPKVARPPNSRAMQKHTEAAGPRLRESNTVIYNNRRTAAKAECASETFSRSRGHSNACRKQARETPQEHAAFLHRFGLYKGTLCLKELLVMSSDKVAAYMPQSQAAAVAKNTAPVPIPISECGLAACCRFPCRIWAVLATD